MIGITIFIGLMGLIVGSFLNVVIERLHAGTDFVKSRSECDHCKHELSPLDLIPLLSWVALRGKCRYCRKPIAIQHVWLELITGALFALAYYTHPAATALDAIILILWLYVVGSAVVLAVYDLKWYLLPDKVLLPIIGPAAVILAIEAISAHRYQVALYPLGAALLFGGAFYALAVVTKGRGMGGGDIKLAFVMGLLLGLQKTALAMLLAFCSAAIFGLALIALKRKSRKDQLPFGPFLLAGLLVAYFAGSTIIDWYLQLSGLYLL